MLERRGSAIVTIPYLSCPCGGRAELDPPNPCDAVRCETCERELPPWYEEIETAFANAGYTFTEYHGWRTVEEASEDAQHCLSCRFDLHGAPLMYGRTRQ